MLVEAEWCSFSQIFAFNLSISVDVIPLTFSFIWFGYILCPLPPISYINVFLFLSMYLKVINELDCCEFHKLIATVHFKVEKLGRWCVNPGH